MADSNATSDSSGTTVKTKGPRSIPGYIAAEKLINKGLAVKTEEIDKVVEVMVKRMDEDEEWLVDHLGDADYETTKKPYDTEIETIKDVVEKLKILGKAIAKYEESHASLATVLGAGRMSMSLTNTANDVNREVEANQLLTSSSWDGQWKRPRPDQIVQYEKRAGIRPATQFHGKLSTNIKRFSGAPGDTPDWDSFYSQIKVFGVSNQYNEEELKMILCNNLTGDALRHFNANEGRLLMAPFGVIVEEFQEKFGRTVERATRAGPYQTRSPRESDCLCSSYKIASYGVVATNANRGHCAESGRRFHSGGAYTFS
jgi:hypothetical protein